MRNLKFILKDKVYIMKKSSSELKYMAKERLLGHYGLFIGAGLLIGGISVVVSLALNMVFPLNNTVSMTLYFISSLIVGLLSSLLIMGISAVDRKRTWELWASLFPTSLTV